MKQAPLLTTLSVLLVMVCSSGCTKISLTKPGSSSTPSATSSNSQSASIQGDWILSFQAGDRTFDSAVTFSQEGNQLVGQGEDNAGAFFIKDGTVNGNKVRFLKMYANADPTHQPVEYTGELEWLDIPDFKGWNMGGHYKAVVNGATVDDKWVAYPKDAMQQAAAAQGGGGGGVEEQGPPPEEQQPAEPSGPPPKAGPNISGMYNSSYTYNFKKIHSKLWLAQDEHLVSGHGIDINTNEHFTISKGWYHYPKVTLICQYVKGKNAAASRQMTLKAKVVGGPSFKGETQFGGPWEAKIVR